MKSIKILTTTALAAGLIVAQGRGPGRPDGAPPDPQQAIQRRVDMLTRALTLTDDQKAQATRVFTDAESAGQSARSGMQTNRPLLSAAVKSNDLAAIEQLSTAIGAATGQLTAIQSKADAAFYALLTPAQKTKFDETPRGGPRGPMGAGPDGGRPWRGAPPQ